MTLSAGTTIGPYRIIEQIGRGGMATVYKAYHAALARNVAIKVLPPHHAAEEEFRERFRAEAVTIAKLRHPNILAAYDFGNENDLYFIVTEYVDGGTLSEQLGSPLPVDYVVRMLRPVASALDYAHARGIVHRDVKPSNVLVARDGSVVVSDFGLARMLMGSLPRLTQTGALVGTPEYMGPEQAAGEEAGPATDRYALAVIAYEMLVGSVPFSADTPLATLIAHLHRPLPLPRDRNPALSVAVEEVLLRGLAKDPKDRFPSCAELVTSLEEAAAAASTARPIPPAPPPVALAPAMTAPAPPPATDRSRRRLLIGGGAAAVLVGAAIAAYLFSSREAEAPPLSVSIELSSESVIVSPAGGTENTIDLTVGYSNNRDTVWTAVVVTLRPMKDAKASSGGTDVTDLQFSVGDLGPWASGEFTVQLSFSSPGSRVVQATITAQELNPGVTSDAQTVNVTAGP